MTIIVEDHMYSVIPHEWIKGQMWKSIFRTKHLSTPPCNVDRAMRNLNPPRIGMFVPQVEGTLKLHIAMTTYRSSSSIGSF